MSKMKFGAWFRQLFYPTRDQSDICHENEASVDTQSPESFGVHRDVTDDIDSDVSNSRSYAVEQMVTELPTELEDEDQAGRSQVEEAPAKDESGRGQFKQIEGHRDFQSGVPLGEDETGSPGNKIYDRLTLMGEQNSKLEEQVSSMSERVQTLEHQLATSREKLAASAKQVERLRANVETFQLRVVKANHNAKNAKEVMRERLDLAAERAAKLKTTIETQRERVIQANARTAEIRDLLKERTEIYKDKLATSREKLILKSSFYDAARRYFGIYRQGLLFDEIEKSNVDFSADAYICLLPSTVPAGLTLSRTRGGRVYCDSVENVEVHKHSLAPRVHAPTLELINLAAFGSLMAVDGILTVGNALAGTLKKFGPPVHVLPNFRRYEDVSPAGELRDQCGLAPDDVLLFASGNVVVGFEPVIQAMAQLPSNVHLAAFVKLKPADYEQMILEEIDRLGLHDRVHFFDFVEYTRLASLASDADIGLITSDISNPNGAVALPNRLFDYLAASLPVIAPPMPDVVDIIERHQFGLTLETVSTENWVEAINSVLADIGKYKDAALRARRELTWESGEDGLIDFLGNPESVTLIGFRDISKYQRFLRISQSLASRGIKVKALFLSDSPSPEPMSEIEFYYFSDRHGLGDGPTRVIEKR